MVPELTPSETTNLAESFTISYHLGGSSRNSKRLPLKLGIELLLKGNLIVTTQRYYKGLMKPMEKAVAPHSSTLTWKIPWIEEPGRLQSMGSLRVGHD